MGPDQKRTPGPLGVDTATLFAAEFPAYEFGTQRTSQGISFVAVNRGRADQPGVYAVVTPDPAEMRNALT